MNPFKYLVMLSILVAIGCSQNPERETVVESTEEPIATSLNACPDWAYDAVMYEVNVRQYSEEGTFEAFAENLPRLKEMGVDILWFMPIHPIGVENRKGTMGSYYSIMDYKAVNPEFGSLEDFKAVVDRAHQLEMKVIIDWVANHTSWDNVWMAAHPDFYTKDSVGNIIPPNPDWSDVADLNYDNSEMRLAMIDAMNYWVEECDIDGYRCDVAGEVPMDFWDEAIAQLRLKKDVFMLAEWDDPKIHSSFNATYGWGYHHTLMEIGKGHYTPDSIMTYLQKDILRYPEEAHRLRFNTNHDENSWKGTEKELFGPLTDNFQILAFTAPGMPLIYSGQESYLDKRLAFFEKDLINWGNYDRAKFLSDLIDLKHGYSCLRSGAKGGETKFIVADGKTGLLVFDRIDEQTHLRIIMNCGTQALDVSTYKQGQQVLSTFGGSATEIPPYRAMILNLK